MQQVHSDRLTRISAAVAKIREVIVDIFIIAAVVVIIGCAMLYLIDRATSRKDMAVLTDSHVYNTLDTQGREAFDAEMNHLLSIILPARKSLLYQGVPLDSVQHKYYVSASSEYYPILRRAKLEQVLGLRLTWQTGTLMIAELREIEAAPFSDLIGGEGLKKQPPVQLDDPLIAQATSWLTICETLSAIDPRWDSPSINSRLKNAVNFIRKLSEMKVLELGETSTSQTAKEPAVVAHSLPEYWSERNQQQLGTAKCTEATLTTYRNALQFIAREIPATGYDHAGELASIALSDPVGYGSGFSFQWDHEAGITRNEKMVTRIPITETPQVQQSPGNPV